jgi:hypothetical protein
LGMRLDNWPPPNLKEPEKFTAPVPATA